MLKNERMFCSKIRAKVEIVENEKNPSNYFCKVEQQKSKSKTISDVVVNDVSYTESKDILNCFKSFYDTLYACEPIDNDVADTFLMNLPFLSSDDSNPLETDFTFEEFETSLKKMQDN